MDTELFIGGVVVFEVVEVVLRGHVILRSIVVDASWHLLNDGAAGLQRHVVGEVAAHHLRCDALVMLRSLDLALVLVQHRDGAVVHHLLVRKSTHRPAFAVVTARQTLRVGHVTVSVAFARDLTLVERVGNVGLQTEGAGVGVTVAGLVGSLLHVAVDELVDPVVFELVL